MVAFISQEPLVPGDTNSCEGFPSCLDVFVRDRRTGTTERASVLSDGGQLDRFAKDTEVSVDGRTLAFAWQRPSTDPSRSIVALHDRLTGATELIQAQPAYDPALSGDGSTVAFEWNSQIWARSPAPSDLSADGDVQDIVIGALDTREPAPRSLRWLRPAAKVEVAAGAAAFVDDEGRVQLTQRAAAPLDLGKRAGDLAMSDRILAARIPASDGGEALVEVCDWPTRATCWQAVGARASEIRVVGGVVGLLVPECPFDQPPGQNCPSGGMDRNGDGDTRDFTLALYRSDRGTLIDTGQAAVDFVLGAQLAAFRTRESEQGSDLNGDGDLSDDVMQVFDLVSRQLFNTENAVTPCPLTACDPRLPYRVNGDTVVYITAEAGRASGTSTATVTPRIS